MTPVPDASSNPYYLHARHAVSPVLHAHVFFVDTRTGGVRQVDLSSASGWHIFHALRCNRRINILAHGIVVGKYVLDRDTFKPKQTLPKPAESTADIWDKDVFMFGEDSLFIVYATESSRQMVGLYEYDPALDQFSLSKTFTFPGAKFSRIFGHGGRYLLALTNGGNSIAEEEFFILDITQPAATRLTRVKLSDIYQSPELNAYTNTAFFQHSNIITLVCLTRYRHLDYPIIIEFDLISKQNKVIKIFNQSIGGEVR